MEARGTSEGAGGRRVRGGTFGQNSLPNGCPTASVPTARAQAVDFQSATSHGCERNMPKNRLLGPRRHLKNMTTHDAYESFTVSPANLTFSLVSMCPQSAA